MFALILYLLAVAKLFVMVGDSEVCTFITSLVKQISSVLANGNNCRLEDAHL